MRTLIDKTCSDITIPLRTLLVKKWLLNCYNSFKLY